MKNCLLFTIVVGILALTLTFSGVAAAEKVVINFWHHQDLYKAPDGLGYQAIQDFNKKYAGKIEVKLNWLPTEQFQAALRTAISTGDLPDIFASNMIPMLSLQKENLIRPLNDLVPADWVGRFEEGAFVENINMKDGNYYSWPERGLAHPGIMIYNKDVLRKAGLDPVPPKTWAEFKEICRKVTEAGKGQYYGLILGGRDDGVQALRYLGITADPYQDADWSTVSGLAFWDYKTGEYKFDSEETYEALKFIIDMKKEGYIFPGSTSITKAEARNMWALGAAAFHIEPQWCIRATVINDPHVDFGVTHLPVPEEGKKAYFPGSFAKADYYVSAKTKYPKEVGIFIDEVLTGEVTFRGLIEGGVVLSSNAIWNNRTDLYPTPQFQKYVEIAKENIRIAPFAGSKNPDVLDVLTRIDVKPDIVGFLQEIFATDGVNLRQKLKDYDALWEAALDKAIAEVNNLGKNFSRADLVFPNWDPSENYTAEDLAEILK